MRSSSLLGQALGTDCGTFSFQGACQPRPSPCVIALPIDSARTVHCPATVSLARCTNVQMVRYSKGVGMHKPKKKKVVNVEPSAVDLAMAERKEIEQRLEFLADAEERVARLEHRAAQLELETVRNVRRTEEMLQQAHTHALWGVEEGQEKLERAEKKLAVARRRQKSRRPTPRHEWPDKERFLIDMVEIQQRYCTELNYLLQMRVADLELHSEQMESRLWREKAEALEARLADASR